MISHLTLKVKYDYLQSSKERLKVEILPNRETPLKKFFHEHTFLAHQLLERRFVLYFFNVPWWYQGDVQLPHNILLQNLLRGSSSSQKYSSFVSLGHLPPSVLPLTPPCWQSRHELEESGLGTILYEEPALSPALNSSVTLLYRGGVGGGGERESEALTPLSDRPRQRPR